MEKIDFVLTWVDSSDLVWLAEKRKWEALSKADSNAYDDANADCRFRSDDVLLRYWFRGVEKFAPWVNRIHFVTCGQKPEWLDENHPKLNLVNHNDYIPSEYLPTFNSNVIELNYHRINELSEQFVLFNDDMFLTRSLCPEFFFHNGSPVMDTNLGYTKKVGFNNWSRLVFNDYCVVNKCFNIKKSILNNRRKWFSIRELGFKRAIRNRMCYLANRTLPVGLYGHIALPHLKSTLQELWDLHPEIMDQSSSHKFRSDDQVNQWLLCAWNQAKGQFYPTRDDKLGINYSISPDNVEEVCDAIRTQSIPQICINDTKKNTDNEYCMKRVAEAFDVILPDKSVFEK
ncbi:MAG: Stealth CR1 domain-containing protein [Bacteroidales bacterium]|nr:Stealth CR1 domain-containing protein [Bacteroidales bacterium]